VLLAKTPTNEFRKLDCLYNLRFDEQRLEKILADGGYEGDIAKCFKKNGYRTRSSETK
jgi:hypothetical protein